MKLFSSHSSYLGVDIGSAGIKVVELKNENGRPRLVTYGFAEEPVDIVHNTSQRMQDKIVTLLTKICQEAKTTSKKTIAALPSFSVFSSIISLPPMNKKELAQAIYWQAKKFVPLPLEEMTLDWKLLASDVAAIGKQDKNPKTSSSPPAGIKPDQQGHKDISQSHLGQTGVPSPSSPDVSSISEKHSENSKRDSAKDLKVLIAAAPKKLVIRYVNVFKEAGLELLSLETENFALERSLVGGDKAPVMIVDIGAITSDISIVENGIPLLSRSVDSGGEAITRAIINSMQVDKKRAEQFKRDIGFLPGRGNLPKVIESAIGPIINEIKYCFDLYASHQSSQGIEKIVLTGGCAFLPNITEYLSKLLNIKVFIGDPWARVIYPVELKSVLDELAPRFSVAVGLAMREIV